MSQATTSKPKKAFKMPHTFVILFVIIAVAMVLTWVVPSGQYARVPNEQGTKVVDATSFTFVEDKSVTPLDIPMIIINAFINNADLILLVLFSGGAIYMLTSAGVLQALVALIARKFSNKVEIFIPMLMLVFALICTTQGVNTFIGFAPITVMLALSLGLDSIVGVGIILLGGAIGFSTGTLNISTTLVAQKIAELPVYSGIGYRWVCFAVYYVITSLWLVRYAKKIQKNPELSPMYDLDKGSEFKSKTLDDFGKLDTRKIICIIALVLTLVLIVYGCINLDWDFAEQSAVFLVFAIFVGIVAGFEPNKICAEFMNGCKKMLTAAFIIGFARAIGSVLSAGVITDTIIHGLLSCSTVCRPRC